MAVLDQFIDRGDQAGKFAPRRQAFLRWVLPDVETADGKPCYVFQTIWNLSLRSKAFREVVNALMGNEPLEGRSLRELVGRAARVTIVHSEGESQTYANFAAIKPVKPGTTAPAPEETLYFSLASDEFTPESLAALPEREQEKVKASSTYRDLMETRKLAAKVKTKDVAAVIDDGFPENLNVA